VVHRDLKPSNILVTEAASTQTRTGQVKLLDFGIARLLDDTAQEEAAPITWTGQRWMTPSYAAPEQVRGEPVTTATDVYALGMILYELLTGHRPYQVRGRTPSEVERVVCEQEPTKPSTAVVRAEAVNGETQTQQTTPEAVSRLRGTEPERLRRRLKGDLDNIVLKALRKEPGQRYASAEQLGTDVARFLSGSPILARKATAGYRLRKFVLRHRVSVAAAALVMLSLVGGLGAALWQAQVAAQERDHAQQERDRAEQAASQAEQVTEFLVRVFEVSNASESRGDTLTALEVLDRGAAWVESEQGEDSEIKAAMMDVLGRIYQNLGRFDEATPFLERALALRRQVHEGAHPEVARSLRHLGALHQTKGDYEAAEQLLQEALAMQQALWQDDHPDIANTLTSLSYLTGELGDYPTTERLRRESLSMRRRLWGDKHPAVAQALNDLAFHLEGMGIYDGEAEALHREALAIRRKVHGPKTLPVAVSLSNLGMVLQNKGDVETAERLQRESVAIRKAIVGENHPTLATGLRKLALALFHKGAYEEAADHYQEALRLFRIAYPKGNLRIARVLTEWGEVRMAQGRTKEAEAMSRQALAYYTGRYRDHHWRIASIKSVLGACLTQQGRYAEAEPMLQDALPHLRKAFGPVHPHTRKIHERLADLYEAWGKPEQAKAYRGEAGP